MLSCIKPFGAWLGKLSLGEQRKNTFAGTGNDVGRNQAAEALHFGLARFHCRVNCGDIAFDEHRNIPASEFFPREHFNCRGLQCRVDRFEYGGKALGLDETHGKVGLVAHRILRSLNCCLLDEGAEVRPGFVSGARKSDGLGMTCTMTGDLHGAGGFLGGSHGGLDIAERPVQLDADAGSVVQLGLEAPARGRTSPWRRAPPWPATIRQSRSGRGLRSEHTPLFELVHDFEHHLLQFIVSIFRLRTGQPAAGGFTSSKSARMHSRTELRAC